LKQTVLGGAAVAAGAVHAQFTIAGTKSSGRVLGANDTVRVGVAGIHGRGGDHIGEYLKVKGAQVTYLIDPDSTLFAGRSERIKDKGHNTPTCVQDVRKALEDENLDALSIAAPNHWHSLLTIWGCQAGKDVYVEKPCSHTLFEGRQCVEAAAKYGRIVQHGTQQRCSRGRIAEMAALHAGKWGKLLVSKGYICKPRPSIGFKPTQEPPKGLDFDLWLGPSALQPFHKNLVHYNWHWFWDFGNGEIGNQGVHQADVARWGIAGSTLPTKVWSLGGRLGYKDQGQTPNMQMAVFEFGDVLLVLEVRGLVGDLKLGKKSEKAPRDLAFAGFPSKVSNEFYTTEGLVRDGKFFPKPGGAAHPLAAKPLRPAAGEFDDDTSGGAFGSFIACVRSRKAEAVTAPILAGHYSAALCHLANISYRLGRQASFSQEPEGMSNAQVAESFETIKRNLKAAGVDLDKTTYQMGRTLKIDPQTEKFVGDEEADKLLTREYRAPYVVPEQV
jgi:predicted dehydrogenase